jgi:signal transduction histidine kinase
MVGAAVWLVFTLSLAGWWLYLGLSLLGQLDAHQASLHAEVLRQRKMLIWEGSAWMLLLTGGGVFLIYLIGNERRSARTLRKFLATFSHDLKTALTSLQLQTEIIREQSGNLPALSRLEADVVRLQLQLENSLFLASEKNLAVLMETVSLKSALDSIKERWPSLKIELDGDALLRADRRALESILSNILQNSQVHGKAKHVRFSAWREGAHRVKLRVIDDGRGFQGAVSRLGNLFERHNPSSGSGIGLYTIDQLAQRMGGEVQFESPASGGFAVDLIFEGNLP